MSKHFLIFLFFLSISFEYNAQNSKVDEKWLTYFEKSNYLETPNYETTIEYFKNLERNSEYCKLIKFGETPQNRELYVLAVSLDKNFSPTDFRNSNKPTILIMNGIHAGEINGKDATMILLREILISKEQKNLIKNVNLLIIPVFNVDGHERKSHYNRINQIGPKEMGWRTTAQNYNLNRDFLKADAPEMKAFLKLFSDYLPEVFIDVHATDGADFQYHTTITAEKNQNVTNVVSEWTRKKFLPYIFNHVEEKGFLISPFAGFINDDPKNGLRDWVASPRFSNGYAAAQNRIGLLIESHVRKTYKDRVFSTKAVLESAIEIINNNSLEVKNLIKQSDEEAIQKYFINRNPFPISFRLNDKYDEIDFKGFEYEFKQSNIIGSKVKVFTQNKFNKVVPYYNYSEIVQAVELPNAYLIPQEYSYFVEILKMHGVNVQKIQHTEKWESIKVKFTNISFANYPFESHFIPKYEIEELHDTFELKKGDYFVDCNQRTVGIIAYLLEPLSNESFVKWGMMNEIFEQKEYFEDYAMEPIAEEMYSNNPELKLEFDNKLTSDSSFTKNSYERLNFFYKKSKYYDTHLNLYPICKLIKKIN